jgi:cyclopropane fatty-acyl-phospholipid synthase-like methyltransferase
MQNKRNWFDPEYGFFGKFYQKGDQSLAGYLSGVPQTQVQRTKEEVEGVIRLLNLQLGSPVLDCPCGIGRHSVELVRRGCLVHGVDINPEQLSEALKEMDNFPRGSLRFHHDTMLSLESVRSTSFDAIINMFFSFGFYDTDEENRIVAKNFFDLLRPDGKFLMHTDVNMARIRNGTYKLTETRRLTNGESLDIMESYNPRTKRIGVFGK